MATFSIKSGDTRPSLEAQLLDEDRQPRDLSTVDEVRFHLRTVSTQDVVVDAAGSVLNESQGKVVYEWGDGDTETTGRHEGEFEIHYQNGTVETFPNNDDIEVYIEDDIA